MMNKKAFTLVEIALVLGVVLILFATVSVFFQGILTRTKVIRTIHDADSIATAAQSYQKATGSWPIAVSDMIPGYLSPDISTSVFGFAYDLYPNTYEITVSTMVPSGHANNLNIGPEIVISPGSPWDTVTLSRPTRLGINARVQYDNIYN